MWQQKEKAAVGRRTLKVKGEVRMEVAERSKEWKVGGRMRQKQKVTEGRIRHRRRSKNSQKTESGKGRFRPIKAA